MTIKKYIEELKSLSDYDLAMYLIDEDPLSRKIPLEKRKEIIEESIRTAEEEARTFKSKYKGISINETINHLGLELIEEESDNAFNFIFLGAFEEPNTIIMYRENIDAIEKKAKELEGILNISSIYNIILAHEIFHKIELDNKDLYTNTLELELYKIGPFKRKSRLICASEIAAMKFAEEVLDLEFNPIILNYLFMYVWNSEEAERIYMKMMKNEEE